MEITEVRVKLMNDKDEKLQAFCSVTFNNDFVVRDLKIIDGAKGPFVAMPSRKLMDRCSRCGGKNHLRSRFCNECGLKLDPNRAEKNRRGRARLHTDIAHPINSRCREMIQSRILQSFEEEKIKAKDPNYVAPSLDEGYDDVPEEDSLVEAKDQGEENAPEVKNGGPGKKDSFDAGIFS